MLVCGCDPHRDKVTEYPPQLQVAVSLSNPSDLRDLELEGKRML